jgi:hypothetical protein
MLQKIHYLVGYAIDGLALLFSEPLHEVFYQRRDIIFAFPQWRQDDGENIEPVIKIGTELPRLHHAPQVLVGRRDNAHVDLNGAGAAQALELLFLKYAEKLGLQFQRKISDFIQKQRTPVSQLEAACGLGHRSRKGASFMTEEFALQQVTGKRRAIESHKTVLAPRASLVDRSCDHLFAGTGFALNQNRGVYWSNQV